MNRIGLGGGGGGGVPAVVLHGLAESSVLDLLVQNLSGRGRVGGGRVGG